jgi:hypothetical protein
MSTVPFKPLDDETLEELRECGFVHVTGLDTYENVGSVLEYGVVRAADEHLGRHDSNNGKIVIVTEDGQVWLASYGPDYQRKQMLARNLCPKGSGAFVPCSNGETIHISALLPRVSDPYNSDERTTDRMFGIV